MSAIVIGSEGEVKAEEQLPRFSFTIDEATKNAYKDIKILTEIKGNAVLTLEDDVFAKFEIEYEDFIAADPALKMDDWVTLPQGKDFSIDGTPPEPQTISIPFEVRIPPSITPGNYSMNLVAKLVTYKNIEKPSTLGSLAIPLNFSIPGKSKHKIAFIGMEKTGSEEIDMDRIVTKIKVRYRGEGTVMVRPTLHIIAKNIYNKVVLDQKKILNDTPPNNESFDIVQIVAAPYDGWLNIEGKMSYQVVRLSGEIEEENFEAGTVKIRIYVISKKLPYIGIGLLSIIIIWIIWDWYQKWRLGKILGEIR